MLSSKDADAPVDVFRTHAGTYQEAVNDSLRGSGRDVEFFARQKARHLFNLARRHVHQNLSELALLDLGCGVGLMHPYISSEFKRVVGVEAVAECVHLARQQNPSVDYVEGPAYQTPYSDGTFDVVTAVCLLHHMNAEEHALLFTEVHRVLKAGGIFVIMEHNPYNPVTQFIVYRSVLDQDAKLVSMGHCKRLATKHRFAAVDAAYMSFLPSETKSALKIESALRRLPLGAQYVLTLAKVDR